MGGGSEREREREQLPVTWGREREERETETETYRERDRDRDRQTETQTETEKEGVGERQSNFRLLSLLMDLKRGVSEFQGHTENSFRKKRAEIWGILCFRSPLSLQRGEVLSSMDAAHGSIPGRPNIESTDGRNRSNYILKSMVVYLFKDFDWVYVSRGFKRFLPSFSRFSW